MTPIVGLYIIVLLLIVAIYIQQGRIAKLKQDFAWDKQCYNNISRMAVIRREALESRVSKIEHVHKYDPHWDSGVCITGRGTVLIRWGGEPSLDPTRKEIQQAKDRIDMLLSHLKLEVKTVPSKPQETKLVKVKGN